MAYRVPGWREYLARSRYSSSSPAASLHLLARPVQRRHASTATASVERNVDQNVAQESDVSQRNKHGVPLRPSSASVESNTSWGVAQGSNLPASIKQQIAVCSPTLNAHLQHVRMLIMYPERGFTSHP